MSFAALRRISTRCHHPTICSTVTRQQSTIVSRRQWNKYLQENNPRLKVAQKETSKDTTASKPWPRSVVFAGYALAGTLIPYTLIWIGLTNETTRPWVLRYCSAAVEQRLRAHFGEPDLGSVSYTDRREGGLAVPYKLMDELDQTSRQRQALIEQRAIVQPVQVRIQVREDTTNTVVDEQILQVPGPTLATRPELARQWRASAAPGGTWTVDFPADPTLEDSIAEKDISLGDTDEETSEVPLIDPLRIEGQIYSLWHYQPVAPEVSTNSKNNESLSSADAIEVGRLRHVIAHLEEELKNSTVATRPIDDITEELAQNRAKLRRLQWKKWLPWS